jgi:argininosuccinate lyase
MLLPNYAINGMITAQVCMLRFSNMLRHIILQKDRMRSIVKSGYSCATEVATYLIQQKGYGGRLAHSIVATMVRNARVKGLKSYECTGEMLDEAAAYLGVKEPEIDTATLQKCFDPDEFIKSHNQLGGTAPEENKRLLDKRRISLDGATGRHHQRREKIRKAIDNLCEIAKTGKIN